MPPIEQLVRFAPDKLGRTWGIIKKLDDPIITRWEIHPYKLESVYGHGKAFVTTHDGKRQLPMAFLEDIRVCKEIENRGVGSLLLQAVIEDCKRRGHKGIEGDLSYADRAHFDKLERWYPKNGFEIKFYDEEEENASGKPGRVWMIFDQ